MSPSVFIERWCAHRRVSPSVLKAAKRSRLRQELCADIKRRFTAISASHVGTLLGVDHTTVIHAWNKHGLPVPTGPKRLSGAERDRIVELHATGLSLAQISTEVQRPLSTVRGVLDPGYAERQRLIKVRTQLERRARQKATREKAERDSQLRPDCRKLLPIRPDNSLL